MYQPPLGRTDAARDQYRVTAGGRRAAPETVVWPSAGATEAVVDYTAPARRLQVCDIYRVRGAAGERVDRWPGNAGMVVGPAGERERIYHCNHAATCASPCDW